jgi:hypothetical protein
MPVNKNDKKREYKRRLQEEARQKEYEANRVIVNVQPDPVMWNPSTTSVFYRVHHRAHDYD